MLFPRLLLIGTSLVGVFLLPWWLSVLLMLLGIILFPHYVEGCALALLFDLAYAGAPLFGFFGTVTAAVCALFIVREIVASRLRHDVFQA